MDVRDVILLAVAGFVAVAALVRLMLVRHNRLLGEARSQIEAERQRPATDEVVRSAGPVRRGP